MKLLGTLKSGEPVYDRYKSHISEKSDLPIAEVLSLVSIEKTAPFYEIEVRLPHSAGLTNVVEVDEGSQIFFAKRVNRQGLSKFVKNKDPQKSNIVSLALKKRENQEGYILITAFWGELGGPEPYDLRSTEQSRDFWHNHAFVDGSVQYDASTVTNETPDQWKQEEIGEKESDKNSLQISDNLVSHFIGFVEPEKAKADILEYLHSQNELLTEIMQPDSYFKLILLDTDLRTEVKQYCNIVDKKCKIHAKWSNASMEGYSIYWKDGQYSYHILNLYCKPPLLSDKEEMFIVIRDKRKLTHELFAEMAASGFPLLAGKIIATLDKSNKEA